MLFGGVQFPPQLIHTHFLKHQMYAKTLMHTKLCKRIHFMSN